MIDVNLQVGALGRLLLLMVLLPSFLASKEKEEDRIEVKIMINKCVKITKIGEEDQDIDCETPKNILFRKLPSSLTYHDLKVEVLKKKYPITYRWHAIRKEVDVFKNPPTHANKIQVSYYQGDHHRKWMPRSLVDSAGIASGDQLYAIVHHKNTKKSNFIVIFLDYEYSDHIIMFLIPTFYNGSKSNPSLLLKEATKEKFEHQLNVFQRTFLKAARKTFQKLLLNDKNRQGLHELHKAGLSYPILLQQLSSSAKMMTFQLLKNGDCVGLRVHEAHPITIMVKLIEEIDGGQKVVNEQKRKNLIGVFSSNVYIDSIVQYLKNKLHWEIDHQLFYQKKLENGGITYQSYPLNRRVERIPNFIKDGEICYVKHKKIAKKSLTEEFDYEKKYNIITLVINKRATSNSRTGQNPESIYLDKKRWPLTHKHIFDLASVIGHILEKETESSKVKGNYEKVEDRLMLYVKEQDKELVEVDMSQKSTTLDNLGIKNGDTVFAIVKSKKNIRQVSFFVKDEKNGTIVLITDNLYKTASSLEEYQLRQIREKAIYALQSLKKERQGGLPLWDHGILDKTELVLGEQDNIWDLANGDIIGIRLKEGYQVLTVTIDTDNDPYSLCIAVLNQSQLSSILQQVQKQRKWDDSRLKEALWVMGEKEVLTPVNLDQTLKEAGIKENTTLYMKYEVPKEIIEEDPEKVVEDTTNLEKKENIDVDSPTSVATTPLIVPVVESSRMSEHKEDRVTESTSLLQESDDADDDRNDDADDSSSSLGATTPQRSPVVVDQYNSASESPIASSATQETPPLGSNKHFNLTSTVPSIPQKKTTIKDHNSDSSDDFSLNPSIVAQVNSTAEDREDPPFVVNSSHIPNNDLSYLSDASQTEKELNPEGEQQEGSPSIIGRASVIGALGITATLIAGTWGRDFFTRLSSQSNSKKKNITEVVPESR